MVKKKHRHGITSLDFLVSFSVMATVMTCATTMTVNISRVWRDVEHQRLAVCELSNQLEELTLLNGKSLIENVEGIEPSEFCKQGLNEPRLTAKLTRDNLGQRIDLELSWKRYPDEKKIKLSGWSIAPANKSSRQLDSPEQGTEP